MRLQMLRCGKCHSQDLVHSRTKSSWERWRKQITRKIPYRCRRCQWRGWRLDAGPLNSPDEIARATRVLTSDEPPNLTGTSLAREKTRHQFDLQVLDAPGPRGMNGQD